MKNTIIRLALVSLSLTLIFHARASTNGDNLLGVGAGSRAHNSLERVLFASSKGFSIGFVETAVAVTLKVPAELYVKLLGV